MRKFTNLALFSFCDRSSECHFNSCCCSWLVETISISSAEINMNNSLEERVEMLEVQV